MAGGGGREEGGGVENERGNWWTWNRSVTILGDRFPARKGSPQTRDTKAGSADCDARFVVLQYSSSERRWKWFTNKVRRKELSAPILPPISPPSCYICRAAEGTRRYQLKRWEFVENKFCRLSPAHFTRLRGGSAKASNLSEAATSRPRRIYVIYVDYVGMRVQPRVTRVEIWLFSPNFLFIE